MLRLINNFRRVLRAEGPTAAVRSVGTFLRLKLFPIRSAADPKPLDEVINLLRQAWGADDIRGLAVLPSAFEFEELYNQRTINLGKYLADHDYGVLFVSWQWSPRDLQARAYQQVYRHVYQIPLYDFVAYYPKLDVFRQLSAKRFFCTLPAEIFRRPMYDLRSQGFAITCDVLDDWEAFHRVGQAPWFDKALEESIVLGADSVYVVSEPLRRRFSHLRNDVLVIGNGYDPERLGPGNIALRRPAADGRIHLGYFGHLTEAWFDWELLWGLAARREDIFIHLIGYGVSASMAARLKEYDNIRYYGTVATGELHEYVRQWHIGLIPFRQGTLAEAVDPIKIYEYLYFGLPAVVTGIRHISAYPAVHYCASRAEVNSVLEQVFKSLVMEDGMDGEAIAQFLEQATWQRRFNLLLEDAIRKNYFGGFYAL